MFPNEFGKTVALFIDGTAAGILEPVILCGHQDVYGKLKDLRTSPYDG